MSFLNCGIRATQLIGVISVLALPMLAVSPASANDRLPQMTPVNGKVSIRFVNGTGADIEYQVVGDTEYRTLAGNAEMTLKDLPVAATLTFRRKDSGLLRVQFRADDPTGTIVVNVGATTDFALDRTTLYIDQQGKIFFN
jgi:hypothetical protein